MFEDTILHLILTKKKKSKLLIPSTLIVDKFIGA